MNMIAVASMPSFSSLSLSAARPVLVERRHHLAVGAHALLDLEAQRPLDQRHVLLEIEIVGVGPVDAADLIDVAEALGRHQRGLGAGALQHGVDGDGRAVQEQAGRAAYSLPAFSTPLADAVDQTIRRRQRLAEGQPAGLVVEYRDVGEGAADVGREADVGAVAGAGLLRTAISTDCHFYQALDCYCFFIAACAIGVQRAVSVCHECRELLRRQRLGIEGVLDDALLDLGQLQDADGFLIQSLHDLLRQALRPREREPCAGDEIVAELLERRHVRRFGPPRLGRHRERAQGAALDLAERRAPGERAHRHAAGDDVGEGRGVVGDVRELQIVPLGDIFHDEMAERADAGRGVAGELVGLRRRDQVVDRTQFARRRHHQDDRRPADIGDVGEVAERIEAGIAGDRGRQDLRREPAHQDGVAVGLGAGDLRRRDDAAAAAAVLDHDALASSAFDRCSAMMRAQMSAAPPGAKVTTMWMGLVGQSARAGAAKASSAASKLHAMRFIRSPHRRGRAASAECRARAPLRSSD